MRELPTYWMWEERLFAVMTILGMGIQYVYLTTLSAGYRVLYRNCGVSLRPTVELCVSMWFQLLVLAASVTLLAFAVRPGVLRASRLQLLIISAVFSFLSSVVLVHVGSSPIPHGFLVLPRSSSLGPSVGTNPRARVRAHGDRMT